MTLPVGSITGFLRLLGAAEFDAGIVGAQKSMNLAAATATKLAGSLDKSDAAFARTAASSNRASVSAARFRAEQLSATAATERYNTALNSGSASAARLASAEASMIRANERVAASMRATGAASESMAARSVASMGKVSKAIRLPVLAAAAGSVYEAAKFQKSMTLIQTAGGETAAKTAAISKGMMQVAQDTGTSLQNLSEGIYTVAKAGAQKWSATEQLQVLKAAAQGAKAENVDLGTSVDALTSVMLGYNVSAQDAVTAENQIIRASGLSKTSMQEFAGSLANVVPLASSLHISFAQIGGAIATMTQHGETAQRATDNLSNLITNLAGQNNVASKAMQQLGLNTVQLQKHLSKNGLTGTLQAVEEHIAKSSKAGMVVVSAFKQAQNATHDLQIELGHMGGQLQKNSKAFADGSMSYKDYRAYVRSLGGDQYALGKNFMTTVDAAKGFNSQLTSGNAPVRTTASELQKLLGGVTGMRTALMLGGTSAKQFATNVKEVQKASLDAGADVLGWNKTQDTLAVKTDKAKASLQVLAVEVGDSLIPALSKLAVEGEHAAHWFDGLSHTQKEVLGWGVGVVAAMGPVLGLGSRLATVGRGIGTFAATSAAELAGLAGASEASAVRIGASMRLASTALAGAGVGLALGEMTKNSGSTTKAVGALGAAMTGAALGMSAGPWGAAIGAAAGGLSALAIDFFHSGDASKEAADKEQAAAQRAQAAVIAQRQAVDDLVQSLQADNDAVAQNTRLTVENDLQKSGAFTLAQKLGISTKVLTNATLGHVGAQQKLAAIVKRVADSPGLLGAGKSADIVKLTDILGKEGVNLHQAAVTADQFAEANGKLNLATRSVAAQFALYGSSLDVNTQIGKQNIRFIDSHVAALLNQRNAGKLTAQGFDAQVTGLRKQLAAYGYNTSQIGAFTRALQHVPKRVLTQIEKKGVTPAEIQALINKYGGLPKSKQTDVGIKDKATPALTDLGALLHSVTGQKYTARVDANVANAITSIRRVGDALEQLHGKTIVVKSIYSSTGKVTMKAAGGTIVGPGTGTSDSVPAWLSKGEEVINAKQASKHRALLKAINAGAAGFASGGTVGTISLGHAQHGTTVSSLIGSGDLGTELFGKLSMAGKQLVASVLSVAASLRQVRGSSTSAVSHAIAASVAPDPSTPQGWEHRLAVAARLATADREQYEIAQQNVQALNKHAAALDSVTRAAQRNYSHLSSEATELTHEASAITGSTKADKARKASLEDKAHALRVAADAAKTAADADQKTSDAADKLASRAKSDFDKIKSASQSATQAMQQDAQQLVQTVQSQFDTLQQTIQTFESGIGSSLTGGSDLSTIAGQLQQNLDTATSALQSAQSSYDSAAQAVQDAQSTVLPGSTAQGATPDQLKALADAQNQLTAAQQAYTAAKAADSAGGVSSVLGQFATQEQQFASDLSKLQASGAGQDLINQLAGLGADAGDALAQGLINDPASLQAITKSMGVIQSIANDEGANLASGFYGAGIAAMTQLISGIETKYPALQKVLAPIAAQLASMFSGGGGSYTVRKGDTLASIMNAEYGVSKSHPQLASFLAANPELAGVGHTADLSKFAGTSLSIPQFAKGVTDFAGGLAYVHKDELLVNMPRGTDVLPANRAVPAGAFGGGPVTINVHMDGRRIASGVAPHLSREIKVLMGPLR